MNINTCYSIDYIQILPATVLEGFTGEMEKPIGKRDWDNIEGGRIDILVSNNSGIGFAIEVKIHAAEQEKQLQRYSKYLKTHFINEKSKVYFLTLEGNDSKFDFQFKDYMKVSFSKEVLNWIESCRMASIDQPIIRETLTQYIANIKRLTNQNPDDQMSDEIIKLITSSDASFKAFEALTSSQSRLYNKFGEALIESIEKHTDLSDAFDINFNNRKIPNKDSEISFFLKGSNDLRVRLYWLDKTIVGIGMHTGNAPDNRIRTEMRKKLSELELGKYLDFPNWAWLSEITELSGQPQLTFDSWDMFKSPEFAEKIANWVKQIADAYKAVKNETQF